MTKNNFDILIPQAAPLIMSLRAIGYSLETAIADIIDNSIDAQADKISIILDWDSNGSYLRIEDNGRGMNLETLILAMRLGSKSPATVRSKSELGRFGMGLKTAAFSIGKRLTVKTKQDNLESVRCWDLDIIEESNAWRLFTSPLNQLSEQRLGDHDGVNGTIVLIENLDKVVNEPISNNKKRGFYNKIDKVRSHLNLTFHRYLEGLNKISIKLNDSSLEPWDPFYSRSLATQALSKDRYEVNGNKIDVQIFILPHHSKLDKEELIIAQGYLGWKAHQGFYIYRNRRLLIGGSWLGLYTIEESSNLARIRIDIDNDSDFDWQIDIKKSKATPPLEIQETLKQLGYIAQRKSHEVYYRRNIQGVKDSSNKNTNEFYWEQVTSKSGMKYKINKNHSLIKEIEVLLDEELKAKLNYYLFGLEEYSPSNIYTKSPQLDKQQYEEMNGNAVGKIGNIIKYYKSEDIFFTAEELFNQICSYESFKDYNPVQIKEAIVEKMGEVTYD